MSRPRYTILTLLFVTSVAAVLLFQARSASFWAVIAGPFLIQGLAYGYCRLHGPARRVEPDS